jgi:hypothetical protein
MRFSHGHNLYFMPKAEQHVWHVPLQTDEGGFHMMSSGSSITPRSILRYRAIKPSTTLDIPTWKRVSQQLPRRQFGAGFIEAAKRWLARSANSSLSLATLVGIGMCLMMLLLMLGQATLGWANTTIDTWRYGMPRTFQVDAYVGHEQNTNQASHFIACNNRGRVEVIEFPGNDATHARIFLGPQLFGSDADLLPVTLQFVDTNHNHYPDMLVHIGNNTIRFHNTHQTFQTT